MSYKNYLETLDNDVLNDVSDDIIKIFGLSKSYLTKEECKNLLNIIFESLFDEKLKNKNFNYIFRLLSNVDEDRISKTELEPIIKSFIVSFDVNYITNNSNFNDKICIKIGKHLLPISYYIKKNE